MESDRYKAPVVVGKIDPRANQINPSSLMPSTEAVLTPVPGTAVPTYAPPVPSGGTAEELTRSANPDVFDK